MNLSTAVARAFSPARQPGLVGVEIELIPVTDADPTGLAAGFDAEFVTAARPSFEPGGQLELSPAPRSSVDVLLDDVRALLRRATDIASAQGVRLAAVGVTSADVPLWTPTPRYLAMQAAFDEIGPCGRRMMRRTASTQVCLDWWPGRDGLEQWRVVNLVAPYLAAAFARGSGADGRLSTWLEVDPSRTAFDGRLLAGDDPVTAYAQLAAGAAVFAAPGDVDQHLTTLFPPVRPRGRYLEVRFPDVQDECSVERLVAAFAALLYDDERRRSTLRRLEPMAEHLADLWRAAADGDPEVAACGAELAGTVGLEVAA